MIYLGDLFDVLPTLAADSIDSSVTDPPYGIGFMGKAWDNFSPAATERRNVENTQIESDNPNLKGRTRAPASSPSAVEYNRTLAGQREFQAWCEKWAREVYRVLKPGAYLVVCGAPRSFHRMTCGIEDAGFEIRDCLSWLFGSGFPKSLDVAKAIDRELGKPRAVAGQGEAVDRTALDMGGATGKAKNGLKADWAESDPNTSEAQVWVGWGTALKPGWEPIILARKPLIGTVASNVLAHGTGGLHIDACRIVGELRTVFGHQVVGPSALLPTSRDGETDQGRWPANVVLDVDAAALLDEQSGESVSTGGQASLGAYERESSDPGFGDIGGASRFFYVAKPSRIERDSGTERLAAKARDDSRKEGNPGGDNPRNRGVQKRGNFHPTVKPIELMRYLVRLVTPPGGTVLDAFTGSGTTGIACRYERMAFIGVEREAEYKAIADARIEAAVPLFGDGDIVPPAPAPPSLFDGVNE